MRRFVHSLLASGLGFCLLVGDLAAAATCFTLQAELVHLQARGVGGSGDRARYERAWREQTNVIARTEARARDAGCFGGGFLFFRREPDPSCGTLIEKLRDMQDNLVRLDRLRMTGGSDNAGRIREVQGMMVARGCGAAGADGWSGGPEGESLYDLGASYAPGGMFRTVCVRTCDGSYFPISYSTGSEQFPADAQTCASMCPGIDTKLYYYPNAGGSPENMVSIDGSHYSDLPTAFRYRTTFEPSCACRPAGGQSPASTALAAAEDPTARLPQPRPAPGEDPETLANRAGNFMPRVVPEDAMAAADAMMTVGGRTIRVVGPIFGPSPEQEAAILSPVPN